MNKKILFITLSILIIIGASLVYLSATDGAKQAKDTITKPGRTSDQTTPPTSGAPGAYIEYSESAITSTTGTKILFFHAPWCPQCRALEADIKAKGIPSGVTIIKVDYDSNQALRQKYAVRLQTTLVLIDDNGNPIKKYVAYDDPTLQAVINNLL